MLPERLHWVIEGFEPEGDPWLLLQIATELEAEGNLEGAAAVLDRAYGLEPEAERVRQARAALLDRLAVREYGLVFRYVPGGPFLMGSNDGEDDEKPLHPVWLAPYWLTETPLSWTDFCRLMGWEPPPEGYPLGRERRHLHGLGEENQLRRHYCQDAGGYDTKPMVAVGWQAAEELGGRLAKGQLRYRLPTEAQWEKAARGGLIGARHAWGNQPPAPEVCDFDRFHAFEIRPSKTLPPNGYGLYAMNGGVWEWTADWYDAEYYRQSPAHEPRGPERGQEKVLRGGSWADGPEVQTVSFRMSRASSPWAASGPAGQNTPTLGFRLCRTIAGREWP
jgi:formylglycine-generating enzyme required for sulfatase activity